MSLNASKFNIGDIVESKAGHDTGRVYIVIAAYDAEFSLAADGEYRKINNPKKKRNKHLRFLAAAVLPEKPTDVKIKRVIKEALNKLGTEDVCPEKTI